MASSGSGDAAPPASARAALPDYPTGRSGETVLRQGPLPRRSR